MFFHDNVISLTEVNDLHGAADQGTWSWAFSGAKKTATKRTPHCGVNIHRLYIMLAPSLRLFLRYWQSTVKLS